jgi:hypothetical protein
MLTSVRALLVATAGIEAGVGIVLLVAPSMLTGLLLGTGPGSPAGEAVARIAGAAVVTLGAICWLERNVRREAVAGLLVGLVGYHVAVPVLLVSAAVSEGLSGIALWPASLLHAAFAGWSLACFRSTSDDGARPDRPRSPGT